MKLSGNREKLFSILNINRACRVERQRARAPARARAFSEQIKSRQTKKRENLGETMREIESGLSTVHTS